MARFRESPLPQALLLSVQEGGQGLTLTEATEVVVVDPIPDAALLAQVKLTYPSSETSKCKEKQALSRLGFMRSRKCGPLCLCPAAAASRFSSKIFLVFVLSL